MFWFLRLFDFAEFTTNYVIRNNPDLRDFRPFLVFALIFGPRMFLVQKLLGSLYKAFLLLLFEQSWRCLKLATLCFLKQFGHMQTAVTPTAHWLIHRPHHSTHEAPPPPRPPHTAPPVSSADINLNRGGGGVERGKGLWGRGGGGVAS